MSLDTDKVYVPYKGVVMEWFVLCCFVFGAGLAAISILAMLGPSKKPWARWTGICSIMIIVGAGHELYSYSKEYKGKSLRELTVELESEHGIKFSICSTSISKEFMGKSPLLIESNGITRLYLHQLADPHSYCGIVSVTEGAINYPCFNTFGEVSGPAVLTYMTLDAVTGKRIRVTRAITPEKSGRLCLKIITAPDDAIHVVPRQMDDPPLIPEEYQLQAQK